MSRLPQLIAPAEFVGPVRSNKRSSKVHERREWIVAQLAAGYSIDAIAHATRLSTDTIKDSTKPCREPVEVREPKSDRSPRVDKRTIVFPPQSGSSTTNTVANRTVNLPRAPFEAAEAGSDLRPETAPHSLPIRDASWSRKAAASRHVRVAMAEIRAAHREHVEGQA